MTLDTYSPARTGPINIVSHQETPDFSFDDDARRCSFSLSLSSPIARHVNIDVSTQIYLATRYDPLHSLSLSFVFFTSLILLLSLSPTLLTISIKIYPAILNRHPSRTSSSFECVLIQVYLRTSPIMFVAGKGSRRWPELTEIRILIMRTMHSISCRQCRVCLFCRKNRSFVTAMPIYISSPQRLFLVTNVLGSCYDPRIPSRYITRASRAAFRPRDLIVRLYRDIQWTKLWEHSWLNITMKTNNRFISLL